MRTVAIYLFLILGVFSCSTQHEEDAPLASVGDKVLYMSDLSAFLPPQLSPEDSSAMAQDYIRNWIKKELVLKKAEENLNGNDKDVSKELEEYRQSLITYKYKKELVRQKMDTTVTDEQIQAYYDANQANFLLRNNIVKAIFMKIPNEFADAKRLKQLCDDNTPESIDELSEYCIRYAKTFDMFDDKWVSFDVVVNNIPEDIDNQGQFLSRNNKIETNDSSYYYLTYIREYRLAGQAAPVDHVYDNIKNLILNTRKIDFLKKTEEDIYQEGVRSKKFKIYNYQN